MSVRLARYFATLAPAMIVLWCYLIWYLVTVVSHFDPAPALWLNALGISAVIGCALILSVGGAANLNRWQIFRFFMMPFGVSSFSALIKDRGFILIASPDPAELALSTGCCAVFVLAVLALRRFGRSAPPRGL